MPGTAGPNLGLVSGYSVHDTGWGISAFTPGFQLLDAITFLSVISATIATPPGSPTAGDRYVVGPSPTGAWAGQAGNLAIYRSGAWAFYTPKLGWRAWNVAAAGYIRFDGSNWVSENAGLYGPVISGIIPTSANTGLTTWGNQNAASVVDGATGISLNGPLSTNDISIRYKAAPATPYSINALFGLDSVDVTNTFGIVFGWYDLTKLEVIAVYFNGNAFDVLDYVSLISAGAAVNVRFTGVTANRTPWLQIKDDGTTVTLSYLPQGNVAAAVVMYSVAKASGYLGATGYSNVCIGVNRRGATSQVTLLSWQVTSP